MQEKEIEEKEIEEKAIKEKEVAESGVEEAGIEVIGETEKIGDAQIYEAAETLRAELGRNESERRAAFCGGALLGVLGTLAVCLFVFLAFPGARLVLLEYLGGSEQAAVSSEGSTLLTASVINKIEQLAEAIDLLYYEDVDDEDLVNGLYKGLFEGIGDVYSDYYTPEEYESLMISATSSLSGIGAVLQQDTDTMQVTIIHVYEGSPAEKAGILAGDVIVQVDDIVSATMELSELVTHIRGEEGTVVHLQLYRDGESDYLELDVERAVVDVPTVTGEMLEDHIGYILISEFGENTAVEFADIVSELEKEGMTSMIVDLRDNPGGMIDSVTAILDQILPEGVVVWTEDKQGNKKEYTSDADCMNYPMAVLINGNSASSSEIFAGAIRDYEYGTLIGTTTFGKGIVQSIRQLTDGSAIKLTTAKYFTPSGENIHGEGIDPDIELEYEYLDPDATEYDMMQDNQILKAIEVLEGN